MENKENAIDELLNRIDQLTLQQRVFQDEIQRIQRELVKLKSPNVPPVQSLVPVPTTSAAKANPVTRSVSERTITPPPLSSPALKKVPKGKAPWEEFVGSNLLNKVGIAVLVLGIGFGAKYSIDNGLINPLTRIVLGYLSGIALLAIAFRLRESHKGFSAVLLSGGMAVLYFITYAAHDFYGLIPQVAAFILMVFFTFFTVFAALRYDLEVIAVIGLVGAYAVPFLLSNGSGRALILFSYMTIINGGILFLAFRKYWKRLYYLSFVLTWLSFASWYAFSFDNDTQSALSLSFSTVFFLTFYITFLAYKLIRGEALEKWDVVCMLFNSFIYFGYGYLTIDSIPDGEQYLGLFTTWTALLHFIACVVIYKTHERSGDIFYFVAGMVLVFLTLAVPVQLEGNWVTIVWAAEAALLFWIGRMRNFPVYERLSYPLMGLSLLSLFHDWSEAYPDTYYYSDMFEEDFNIFLNVQFLTSMVTAGAFLLIAAIRERSAGAHVFKPGGAMNTLLPVGIPLIAAFVFYAGIYKEIEAFWNNAYAGSRIVLQGEGGVEYNEYNQDLMHFRNVWLMIYSALFAWCLGLLYLKRKTNFSAIATVIVNSIVLMTFVTAGLLELGALRSSFLQQHLATYYDRDIGHILLRYIALAVMLPLLWSNHKILRRQLFDDQIRKVGEVFLHLIVLLLLSSELIHWLDVAQVQNTFKLSLSILWGCYGLFLVVFGLSRDQKHIRVAGIVLFGVTLVKLFAYDMADMSTILKTVVMVILGALLLTASFIYNKYKRSENETP